MPPPRRYRADPAWAEGAVDLEGLTAVYHPPSGQTHLLAAPAPRILAALAAEPRSAAELAASLAEEHSLSPDAEPILEARLQELAASGLITPA